MSLDPYPLPEPTQSPTQSPTPRPLPAPEPDLDARHHPRLAWWPGALGLALALLSSGDAGVSPTIASVVAVIALIYVAAAVTGRPAHAWWSFLLSFPVVLSGELSGIEAAPFLLMGVIAVVLLLVGRARGTWADPRHRMQLYALLGFGAVAIAGAATAGALAVLLVAGGLLAHAAWDVLHHRCDLVVGPRYAEFCAVLDAALAVTLVWGLV